MFNRRLGGNVLTRAISGIALLLILGVVLGACGGGQAAPTSTPKPAPTPTAKASATQPPSATVTGEVVKIVMTENPYRFQPDTFNFQLGKTYVLTFSAPKVYHTFTVSDLGINISINAGESVTKAVTFNKAGKFRLVCTPHDMLGMVGEFNVQ